MFENLKNPLMGKTIGKVATLEKAALIGGLKVEDMIAGLTAKIDQRMGSAAVSNVTQGADGSDHKKRQEILKVIIKDLHDGEDMEVLKQRLLDWD